MSDFFSNFAFCNLGYYLCKHAALDVCYKSKHP